MAELLTLLTVVGLICAGAVAVALAFCFLWALTLGVGRFLFWLSDR